MYVENVKDDARYYVRDHGQWINSGESASFAKKAAYEVIPFSDQSLHRMATNRRSVGESYCRLNRRETRG